MSLPKTYYEARTEAIKWLNGKRDFAAGINILQKSGYKPSVCAKIAKWGDIPHSRQKLEYEIRQMIQVWAKPNDPRHEDVDFDETDPDAGTVIDFDAKIAELGTLIAQDDAKESDKLPGTIRKVIYDLSDAYKSRSQLHKQLSELPEDNSEPTVTARKTIVTAINALSSRMEVLYDFRRNYEENGVIPTEEQLAPSYHDPERINDDPGNKDADQDDNKPVVLPATVDELKKLRKSEATKLTRARNMLLYQSEAKPKDQKENPLPDCPKRVKYEKKVEMLTTLIVDIDYKIAQLS